MTMFGKGGTFWKWFWIVVIFVALGIGLYYLVLSATDAAAITAPR